MTNIPWLPRRHDAGYRAGYHCAVVLVIALVMVARGDFSPAGHDGVAFAQTPNPCALLMVDEIQPLTPNASIGSGVPTSLEAVGTVGCRYTWGTGVNRHKLDVVVSEAPRMFPGLTPDQVRERLLGSVRVETTDAVISDVGDAAVFTSDSPYYARATAALKGRILAVRVDGLVAREGKDQVISLLKSAASRL